MRDKIWMRRRRRSLSFQRKLLLHEKLKGEKGSWGPKVGTWSKGQTMTESVTWGIHFNYYHRKWRTTPPFGTWIQELQTKVASMWII